MLSIPAGTNFSRAVCLLKEEVSAAPFFMLRLVFGLLMAGGTLRFMLLGWVDDHYIQPVFHFSYFGLSWLPLASPSLLYAGHILLIGVAILFALGIFYRPCAIMMGLLFTYFELIDLAYYLNHYYFVSLACFLFCWVPAPLSNAPNPGWTLPRWSVWMFRLMLGLVYVYAGMAKINSEWLLKGLPLSLWLPAHASTPVLGALFSWKPSALLFSWFGMVYDLTIPLFLMWRPTRPWAYSAVVVFHLLTGLLFQIGVFPVVMMGATLVFFSDAWHERILSFLRKTGPFFGIVNKRATPGAVSRFWPWAPILLGLFFAFQILFPWRYLLYPGNIFWTEEGYRFSWRVMLMEKAGTALFYVRDGVSGKEGIVDNRDFLNAHQEKQMAMQPDMVLQYAQFLARHYAGKGVRNPEVRAEIYVTLNGNPSRPMVSPDQNLLLLEDNWAHKSWILPHEL